jgi:hypothetical protein
MALQHTVDAPSSRGISQEEHLIFVFGAGSWLACCNDKGSYLGIFCVHLHDPVRKDSVASFLGHDSHPVKAIL